MSRFSLVRVAAAVACAGLVLSSADVPALADNPLNPAQPASAAFVGTFSGDKVSITLAQDAAPGNYRGELTVGTAKFPCTASDTNGTLTGTFTAGGATYTFTGTLQGDQLSITSDGNTHALRRAAIQPANPIPRPNPIPQPPANVPAGAVGGIGAKVDVVNGKLVLTAIAPGGPAARAKLQPGGVLVAVDGKNVEGMTVEQVGPLVRGTPGTMVTLTLETDTEVMTAILERAAIPQVAPNPQPGPQPIAPPVAPSPVAPPPIVPPPPVPNAVAPLTIKPGLRVTYYSGSATLPSVRTVLTQDDDGNWINPATNQRYAEADNPGTGGAGYQQLTVVAADGRDVVTDARTYVLVDPQRGLATSTTATAYGGTPEGLGEFWQPPAKLAAMQDGNQNGFQIRRVRYPIAGKTFNAIAITSGTAAAYQRNVFDLDTGLLIAASSSSVGTAQVTPNPNGTATAGAGATMITSTRLLQIRQLNVPWANQPSPAWAKAGARLDFAGTYRNHIEGAPEIAPWKLQVSLAVGEARPTWMPCKQTSRLDTGASQPQESQMDRAVGWNSVDPIYIDPQILARLQPNTVIDEDKVTKRRTVYTGQQNGFAVLLEDAPFERTQLSYDPRSGILVGIQQQTQQGVATIITAVQLQNRP